MQRVSVIRKTGPPKEKKNNNERLDPGAMAWDCLDLVNSLLEEGTESEELEQISFPFSIPGDICLDSIDQNIIVNLGPGEETIQQHSQKQKRKRGRKKGYRSEKK